MSAEMIAFHARRDPHQVAMQHAGRQMSYQVVGAQVARLATALLSARVTERHLVGVAHGDPLVHTMLLLALEALGVATLPFVQPTDGGIVKALGSCDLVICEHRIEALPVAYVLIDAPWLSAVFAGKVIPELLMKRTDRGRPINIFTTSGSMGVVKSIVFDAKALRARVSARLWQYGLERASRVLVAMPISTSSSYFVAQAAFRVGATLVFFDAAHPLREIGGCSHAIILPIHLQRLAEGASQMPRPGQRIKVFVVGAKLSPHTRRTAHQSLNAEVSEAYGTTETGWLAMMGDDHIGDVLPGVEVEVVNAHDQVLAPGVIGQIRAKSAEMGLGYLDLRLSSRAFRDGWYYTGDSGRVSGPRRIQLMGREDALMNFGGIKISPETIEEALTAGAVASDVAALSRTNLEGIEQLYVACVAPRLGGPALDAELIRLLGPNLGLIRVAVLERIPRNAAGKLLRAELRDLVEHALLDHAEGTPT